MELFIGITILLLVSVVVSYFSYKIGIGVTVERVKKGLIPSIEHAAVQCLCNKLGEIPINLELNYFVRTFYNNFIIEPKNFVVNSHDIEDTVSGIKVWCANSVENREFTSLPINKLKELYKTQSEVNKQLTLADKQILDTICTRLTVSQKEFVNRVFI